LLTCTPMTPLLTCANVQMPDLGLEHGAQHRCTPASRLPACVFAGQGLFQHPTVSRTFGQLSLGFSGLMLTGSCFSDGASDVGKGARGVLTPPRCPPTDGHDQPTQRAPKTPVTIATAGLDYLTLSRSRTVAESGGAQHSRSSPVSQTGESSDHCFAFAVTLGGGTRQAPPHLSSRHPNRSSGRYQGASRP
jgi:hypothetical protein